MDSQEKKALWYIENQATIKRSMIPTSVRATILIYMTILSLLYFVLTSFPGITSTVSNLKSKTQPSNTITQGYQCFPNISHNWGQYSPYFSLSSESSISPALPRDCGITFVQLLSRHGARFPTTHKGKAYKSLIEGIQNNATSFKGKYSFLESYTYSLGTEDLTLFGEDEMIDSGTGFYHRYKHLIQNSSKTPFIRSSGQKRVVDSARKFIEGYQLAQADDGPTSPSPSPHHPKINVIINEGPGSNDSLNHGTCPRFESCKLGEYAELNFTSLAFAPPIRRRLESDIPGISLTDKDIIYLMDLCPFETVALSRTERDLSPFCSLFSPTEWRGYNYAKSLEKYYSFGDGNPLGPTQGVGFVNELIARLTRSPVRDSTSTNKTLDNDPVTFPVDRSLYADFSHDNPMLAVMFALRAFEGMEEELKWDRVMGVEETAGFSAAWTVPFGARLVVEGMRCGETGESGGGDDREMVRVLVNDRVAGLKCSDGLGRCRVDEFVEGLEFARDGGLWDDCFNTSD